jgi:hypothetical protein
VLGLLSVTQLTLAEDLAPNIFIRIHSPHGDDREVQVVDEVCERLVWDGRLGSRNYETIEVCSRMGRGEISIIDLRSGQREHHRDVLDGMWFATP